MLYGDGMFAGQMDWIRQLMGFAGSTYRTDVNLALSFSEPNIRKQNEAPSISIERRVVIRIPQENEHLLLR